MNFLPACLPNRTPTRSGTCLIALIMFVCAPQLYAQSSTVTEIGKIAAAEYRIDIPMNWNGRLVMYCHGYSMAPGHFQPDTKSEAERFVNVGYATAQSGYSSGGWAVREAMQDTEALRQYFVKKFGTPAATYVTGPSLGGFLVTALIESYPDSYSGGLALCAPLGAADWFMARRVFDFRVVFDYYFPGIFPSPAKVPRDYAPAPVLAEEIGRRVKDNPKKAEALARFAGVESTDELGGLAVFFTSILTELEARASGNPFDNQNVVYEGLDDADALNRGVRRYTADPAAAEYLRTYYTSSGRLRRPVLAVRNTYDPLIPAWVSNAYLSTLEHEGGSGMFINQLVERHGHCAITGDEANGAFEELVHWISNRMRPRSGILPYEASKTP